MYEIQTLGTFEVIKDDISLLEGKIKNSKSWDSFKFLLTFRNKKIHSDDLCERISLNTHSNDPKALLRKQMQRLRQLLSENHLTDHQHTLLFHQGFYQWNPAIEVKLDTEIFEAHIQSGNNHFNNDPEKALKAYSMAISLYKGDYLSECTHLWVYAIRNHYRLLYVDTVYKTIHLLKKLGRYMEIIEVAENAISVDMNEEKFHMHYIEALYMQGNLKSALTHYEKITSHLYHTYNLSPSRELLNLYKRMMERSTTSEEMEDVLIHSDDLFPYYCPIDVFKSIYVLEHRRSERIGSFTGLGKISQLPSNAPMPPTLIEDMQCHILKTLRRSDCFTSKNDKEFLILLPDTPLEATEHVFHRLFKTFPNNTYFKYEILNNYKNLDL